MPKRKTLKPKPTYRCEQDELYAVCMLAWNSCKNNIAKFVLLKALYTLTFIAGMITELMAAAAIPGYQARSNVAEALRMQLAKKTDQCLDKWQLLKIYITEAFPVDMHKLHLQSAGSDFYSQAIKYNWEKVASLMTYASQFIQTHLTELTANNNMPAAFQAEFSQLSADTTALYVDFQEALDQAEDLTSQKINANNNVHAKLMKMLKDGQQIFRYDPAKRELFTFDQILERVRGASSPFEEFEIPANSSIKIKRIVANSPFTNIGETELVVCNGDVTCTVGNGTTVSTGATIIIQEGVNTITVLNTDTAKAGKCRVRVTKS